MVGGDLVSKDRRYVTGDTNWDSYELPQLVAMVTEKVDLPGLVGLADDWREAGNGLVESGHELADGLDGLMDFWSGDAAEQARTDVALNAQWLTDLGATAYDIGTPIEDSAGALKAAQDQMPQLPVTNPAIAPGSAPDGAAFAGDAGGPLGAAIGGTANGTDSAAQAAQNAAELKRQAVETMQRFETAAIGIEQAVPEFTGPSKVLRPRPPETTRPIAPPVTPPGGGSTGNEPPSWQDLTGAGSGTSAQQDGHGHGRSGAEHGTAVGGGGTGSIGAGSTQVPGAAAIGAGRLAGGGPATGAVPTPERLVASMPPGAGAMIDPDGHPGGMAGAGAPVGGMGAGAGAGTGNDHRRRVPVDADDPFSLDKKASPPVIGL
jgi:hypothetical protein